MEVDSRKCRACLAHLPTASFSRSGKYLRTRCKACDAADYLANKPEARRARQRELYWQRKAAGQKRYRSPEARERKRAQQRAKAATPEQREYMRRWRAANAEKLAAEKIAWRRRKMKEDPAFAMAARVRLQVFQALRGAKKARPTFELLGYTREELKAHIERQFVKGMGWHNMGEWHLDHIVPQAAFRYETPEDPDFRRAWALTNLRPLWAKENQTKFCKRIFLI